MYYIIFKNILIFGYHGCLYEEKKTGNYFSIDLKIKLFNSIKSTQDDVSLTINYVDVYMIIKKEMKITSNLLESVADRIINTIAKKYQQKIYKIIIKLCKLNPALEFNSRVDKVCVIAQINNN